MFIYTLVLLLVIAALRQNVSCEANIQSQSFKIINGNEAAPHSLPYQAAILGMDGKFLCGGSLISPRSILTAAHCLDRAGTSVQVVLGAHNISNPGEEGQLKITSTQFVIHKDWNAKKALNDIALVILPKPIETTNTIKWFIMD
ncbi:unnamed protein product [Acanthoscelides obtectus]|uniref:Peptidase S1 domain-containing protein n=1 Tax=Acanthoscelides obtectus TaxID=200917 RepID=A0A9P0LNS6_ACAOB|nr:unnamed protein product [Acanthoscelides obtectus]CAK1641836.1 hypothetical protein AOBTE_LOCUS12666 [Acanthoscelides obtectus]